MSSILRTILAVIVGAAVAMFIISGVHGVSSMVYPMPETLDMRDIAALNAFVAQLPLGAFLFILLAWALGALVGSWVATRIAPGWQSGPALVVGGLLVCAAIWNMTMIAHPTWFWAAGIAVFPVFTYLGMTLARVRAHPAGPERGSV